LVFQWNVKTLSRLIREAGFVDLQSTRVSLGRWVILLGRKWPSALLPVRVFKLIALKPAG